MHPCPEAAPPAVLTLPLPPRPAGRLLEQMLACLSSPSMEPAYSRRSINNCGRN